MPEANKAVVEDSRGEPVPAEGEVVHSRRSAMNIHRACNKRLCSKIAAGMP
jgi:hypothetical protein